MEPIKINIPEGYKIDEDKSDLSTGKIEFKKIQDKYSATWDDIKDSVDPGISSLISVLSEGLIVSNIISVQVILSSIKLQKRLIAELKISALKPYYGWVITDNEWENSNIGKYVIKKWLGKIDTDSVTFGAYNFLAFHTEEQRDCFLKYNEQLIKDYLMTE